MQRTTGQFAANQTDTPEIKNAAKDTTIPEA